MIKKAVNLFIVLMFCCVGASAAELLTYRLLPGSTYTPVYGAYPIGPTESMTGYFTWSEGYSGGSNEKIFIMSDLSFQTASFSIIQEPPHHYASTINIQGQVYFWDLLQITNLSGGILVGEGRTGSGGQYLGTWDRPTYINVSDIGVCPENGGYFFGKMTIVAELVPEPATIGLLAAGGILLRKRRA